MPFQNVWSPDAWRARPAMQLPTYADPVALREAEGRLSGLPSLIFPGEVSQLRSRLAAVAGSKAFLLQGGDCAESFDEFGQQPVESTFRVILQMAVVLTYAAACPVVKVGRIAGQFAKPRSSEIEVQDGKSLPSYRGDIINGSAFDAKDRQPDPSRLLSAYSHSATTLNLLRALSQGGFADLHEVHRWTADFVRSSPQGERFEELADRITQSLAFMAACGFDAERAPQLHAVEFYTSHEALHLHYEEALTRLNERTGRWYGGSAHMLWLGERTRQLDGAHVEYLRGIENPIGVKLGPTASPDDVLRLIDVLDPDAGDGRLVLITRMGSDAVAERLPPLLRAVRRAGRTPVWCCDPMHGNTVTSSNGYKTRDFGRILLELRGFFAAHAQEGTYPGGLHFEMTGQDVTECRGGAQALTDEALSARYRSACDPRLNGSQSLELAFMIADVLKAARQ
ncbi:class II 3-deoxy-7-phosphoheptulonate synthase [Variovorax ginsengisoli]|uniref:Phospho-2-dehydro-3-deoxyheptonate aldolase n=1 Tax=Variovorax ginsengisoli TaxID=363844 RepID=A0ABT8SEV2_9BURK|nr:3-deoxy-7-phosphoheptulonate synthase class II [Variovorax ginsengisoli]MDN8618277.1 3-deoxy-7-phosphoheptulonate synthase class II [Variovorax ginsengisoli]MDO1537447.1 3-deoxy-7-phosphoheptulonate synthase class II [Variovorax ginsengisoli]